MRLFIAIKFDKDTINRALEQQKLLQANATRGTYTTESNLHLTLLFLGEVEASYLEPIKIAMEDIECKSFFLRFTRLGYFEKPQGDIWWIGGDNDPRLQHLEILLSKRLSSLKLPLSQEAYRPHLTLARNVRMPDEVKKQLMEKPFPWFGANVSSFTLIHSHRVDSLLTYSPLFTKEL
ncbi:2'-5' RNA ligase [Sphaerochaeta pleomorpha str. Grapes]|uniref:RNA 2',3'-cyclic phosphodiesterase n=1 Tax=Sphaerochaeta pleomorpha (strain ATCC BAA-1885 / DSM 22778 / Grapes) TaxID=158190 RepID=G8QUX7_SPHPG|nr:RNA 2',3'-cyclic phosphodiesterase [Sphaerochaeta pleomorpha]AEV28153.1 2'-5' RNA ligase [Sphaerochaeta pleomorpha str. Grapes]